MIVLQWVLAILLAAAITFVAVLHWKGVMNNIFLSRAFFLFGLIFAAFGVITQSGVESLVGSQTMFADPMFYLQLSLISMVAAVYWNTDKSTRIL